MSRKDLVDGSTAYKERKFTEAEELFRTAAERDPEGATAEGRTAQVFLARTLHSLFIGDRKNTGLAEQAIAEYKKALGMDKEDQGSYKAVAGLYENLARPEEWQAWVSQRANDASIKPQFRAEALTALTAKKNSCANEITDTEKTKKTVKRDGKDVFEFVKPEKAEDLARLQGCVSEGLSLIDQAVALEPADVSTAALTDPTTLTDAQLKAYSDTIKAFESARSYKASMTLQASRLAEMEGRTADRDRYKTEADEAKTKFTQLSELSRKYQAEIERRIAVAQEAANANKDK